MKSWIAASFVALGAVVPISAEAAPQAGQRFGDWTFSCTALAQDKTVCSLKQILADKQKRTAIAQFQIIQPYEQQPAKLQVKLPLGLSLPAGVRATVDEGATFDLTLTTCVAGGCFAASELNDALESALLKGQKLTIDFKLAPSGRQARVTGSLTGLTAAFKETGW